MGAWQKQRVPGPWFTLMSGPLTTWRTSFPLGKESRALPPSIGARGWEKLGDWRSLVSRFFRGVRLSKLDHRDNVLRDGLGPRASKAGQLTFKFVFE